MAGRPRRRRGYGGQAGLEDSILAAKERKEHIDRIYILSFVILAISCGQLLSQIRFD
jgi:hypothetical protein